MARRIRWSRFLGNLLFLLCFSSYLFLTAFSWWFVPQNAGPYWRAMTSYFYGELAYSLLPIGFLLLLIKFIRWIWRRAKTHPLNRRRQQRSFKIRIWTSMFLLLVTVYFTSILGMETYYAYLDSFNYQEIHGKYVGMTDNRVRVNIDNSQTSFPLLAPAAIPLHFDEEVIIYKGPKTGQVVVEKAQ